jgi:hypothetical protein
MLRGSEQSEHYALSNFKGLAINDLGCGSIFDDGRKHLSGTQEDSGRSTQERIEITFCPTGTPAGCRLPVPGRCCPHLESF